MSEKLTKEELLEWLVIWIEDDPISHLAEYGEERDKQAYKQIKFLIEQYGEEKEATDE